MRPYLLLVMPFLPGCLACGYPSITYTPLVANLEDDVRAFKVSSATGGMRMFMTGGEWFAGSIEELPLQQRTLDSQKTSYFAYYIGGFPASFSEFRNWHVLLYRPGYEVIEVSSRWWGKSLFERQIDKLPWKSAPDLDSQAKALETLCPTNPSICIRSKGVREFAASEYERLAASSQAITAGRQESLLATARRLRSESSSVPGIPQPK